LWNNWKNFSSTLFKHVEDTLNSKESVWINFLPYSFKEDWKIMMVIKLLDINFPINFVLWTMFNGNWKISSIVEKSEFTDRDLSTVYCSSSWLNWNWFCFWLIQTKALSTESISLFQNSSAGSGNRYLLLVNWLNGCNSLFPLINVFLWEITESRMLSSW